MVVPRKNELKSRQFGGSTCSPMGRRVLVPVVGPMLALCRAYWMAFRNHAAVGVISFGDDGPMLRLGWRWQEEANFFRGASNVLSVACEVVSGPSPERQAMRLSAWSSRQRAGEDTFGGSACCQWVDEFWCLLLSRKLAGCRASWVSLPWG